MAPLPGSYCEACQLPEVAAASPEPRNWPADVKVLPGGRFSAYSLWGTPSLILAIIPALLLGAGQGSSNIEMRLMRYPAVHGDTIVFTYASDLWVGRLGGGEARRLTTHSGSEALAHISPD